MEHVTLTREKRNEQAWSTPASKLGAQYGVSDIAMAKSCAKYELPQPRRSFWAQLGRERADCHGCRGCAVRDGERPRGRRSGSRRRDAPIARYFERLFVVRWRACSLGFSLRFAAASPPEHAAAPKPRSSSPPPE
jgi:hypothetical protein